MLLLLAGSVLSRQVLQCSVDDGVTVVCTLAGQRLAVSSPTQQGAL